MSPRNQVLEAVKDELTKHGVQYSIEQTNNNHLAVKFCNFIHIVSSSCGDHRAIKKARCLVKRDLRSIGHPGL